MGRGGCGRTRPSGARAPCRRSPRSRASRQRRCVRSRRAFGNDAGVGAEDPGDVGVDLALVGAERRGERDRRRVRATSAEGRDVVVGRDALEAGDDRHDPRLERLDEAMRPDLDDARLGVRRVGDDPRLAAGERGSRHAQVRRVPCTMSAIEMRSPEVSNMSSSRPGCTGLTSSARRSRLSVVLPIAETTTTTRRPPGGCGRCGRRPHGSGRQSATEVPPNFFTT